MTGFAQRLALAESFELEVIDALRLRGWTAERFGQGQLSPAVREFLRTTDTALRRLPDIIACRRSAAAQKTYLIDAKAGDTYRRTGRHAIEAESAEKLHILVETFNVPVYLVFESWQVLTPAVLLELGTRGQWNGRGSGTPFLLIGDIVATPFNALFGPRRESHCDAIDA